MKKFIEEYGFGILMAIVIIILIGLCTPIGRMIKLQIINVAESFTTKTDKQFDAMDRVETVVVLKEATTETASFPCTITSESGTDVFRVEARVKDQYGNWGNWVSLGNTKAGSSKEHDFSITAIIQDGNYLQIRAVDENSDPNKLYESNVVKYHGAEGSSFAITSKCLAKGTLIALSNNLYKSVEDIKIGDEVLTLNHETGEYEVQKVYLVFTGSYKAPAMRLSFASGNEISIVGEHDLFELETLKYEVISTVNYSSYIGKHFYNVQTGLYEELISVEFTDEVEFYSIYTEQNHNCIANGFLTIPDDVDYYGNIYELDINLKADMDKLAKDIETFGLFAWDESFRVEEEYFNKNRAFYVNIIVGKNLATMDELFADCDEYLSLIER